MATTLDTYSHINVDSSKQSIADALSKAFNDERDTVIISNSKVDEFKRAKADAQQLGLTMDEYYEYLEYEKRMATHNE